MVGMGVPITALTPKMVSEGLDPAALSWDPEKPLPASFDALDMVPIDDMNLVEDSPPDSDLDAD
jgi:hypothetical protein